MVSALIGLKYESGLPFVCTKLETYENAPETLFLIYARIFKRITQTVCQLKWRLQAEHRIHSTKNLTFQAAKQPRQPNEIIGFAKCN